MKLLFVSYPQYETTLPIVMHLICSLWIYCKVILGLQIRITIIHHFKTTEYPETFIIDIKVQTASLVSSVILLDLHV